MRIVSVRSDGVYSKIMNAPFDRKNDIYRYELMKPFEKKVGLLQCANESCST